MKNRTGVVLIASIVTLLCAYYLSLTFVTNKVERRAEIFAQDSSSELTYLRKQYYLDSVWNEPVFHFLGLSFTYKELKETELNLGLDLQGGMHVVLEVSPSSLLEAMAQNEEDPSLRTALRQAEKESRSGTNFLDAFYTAFQKASPGTPLSAHFAHINTRGKIDPQDSDTKVLDVLQAEIDQAIERSFYILRARIDKFGTTQPNIQRLEGTNRIQIELPGVDNPERVRKLLQGIAKLAFWKIVPLQELLPTLSSLNEAYVERQQAAISQDSTTVSDPKADSTAVEDLATLLSSDTSIQESSSSSEAIEDSQETSSNTLADPVSNTSPLFSLLQANDRLIYSVSDTLKVSRMLQHSDIRKLIPESVAFLWAAKSISSTSGSTELLELYAISSNRKRKAPLSGDVVTDARQDFDQYGRPAISMQMSATGAKKWRKVTQENLNERIAIVLDDKVYSAPVVESEIKNGNTQITGDFTVEEAKDLANILKSGALPAPTQIVEDIVIGPTLGKQAQEQGMISMLSALLIVVIFMVIYYARSGFVADLALAFNVFFILGILTQLNSSLTLPGIAGIVLTMGMSIDANVLIFERIREELRRGTTLRGAIQQGYQRAYSSIVDANVTTFLTAAILYLLGQGPIKGFAITLMVGIICSFFTAVFLTRLIITWILERKKEQSISFSSFFSRNLFSSLRFSIITQRRKAYLVSGCLILLGLVAFLLKGGMNLGIDFLGGRAYVVSFPKSLTPSLSDLKVGLSPYLGDKGVEIKTYGEEHILRITTNYLTNDDTQTADQQVKTQLTEGLQALTGLQYAKEVSETQFAISGRTKIGATIASDIKRSATKSIILALIVIFLYIFIRFRRWQFGIGALVALFHDVLIVLSAFSIAYLLGFSFEVDQVFIAAMLTLIGYSINDTVVIFDRVRENLRLHPKGSIYETFNLALNETLSRTLITSATTLFVVLVLLLFGGAVLRGFSFTLLVGILTGTYSSLFIAVPVVADLIRAKK